MNNNAIEVTDLVKRFGNFTANNNLNFNVGKGEIFGFLGANGAGKTTAVRILVGLSRPTSGRAVVAGFDVARYPDRVKRNIGYMCQKFSLYEDLTVEENIMLFGGIYGIPVKRIREKSKLILARLNFEEYGSRIISGIPAGMRQKLAFSVALLHEPAILFLDEPTGGVDPVTRREFWEMIYETASGGVTVFVTTHYMDEAEYCDRISVMNRGKITVMGTPSELKREHAAGSIEELFIRIARDEDKGGN